MFLILLFSPRMPCRRAVGSLLVTLADDIPVFTSATSATGQQGQPFSYTITATNDPVLFSAISIARRPGCGYE